MSNSGKAWLALENGLVLEGRSVGAPGERGGDLVFNTAMTGYHEILTDPSYAGQVVLMTYPLIGNYGIADEDAESESRLGRGLRGEEMSRDREQLPLDGVAARLARRSTGVVAIEGVDTRRLTRVVRDEGSHALRGLDHRLRRRFAGRRRRARALRPTVAT